MRVLKEQHLKFSVRQGDALLTAIGFRMAERYFTAPFPQTIDIVFTPQNNTFNNNTETQLVLKDMRAAE
jgi:single-stranded-DNA-specific exonuclease